MTDEFLLYNSLVLANQLKTLARYVQTSDPTGNVMKELAEAQADSWIRYCKRRLKESKFNVEGEA